MSNRLIIPLLLCAATVAFASSSTSHKDNPTKKSAGRHHEGAALASSFTLSVRDGVHFALELKNNSDRMIEIRFPSGMTHDFVVLDEGGKEVWRWSDGRMFTQSLQNKLIKSHDNAVFAEGWPAVNAHGKFTAVAILTSENHPVKERVEFELK